MEAPFDVLDGVLATTSGYTGGAQSRPSYGDVCTGRSGHAEAVQVLYDPTRVTYGQLLDAFWRACDPTDGDGQFVDRGNQYRPAIFTHSEAQAAEARAARDALQASGVYAGRPVVAQIQPAVTFWPAENYHQDYYSKARPWRGVSRSLHRFAADVRLPQSNRYPAYRFASGRDAYIARVWGEEYVRHEQEAAKVTAAAFQEQRRAAAEARKKSTAAGV
jgi:methionine-S-sulfoxide reductase